MRPIKLTMEAFVRYAGRTEVDFSALKGGLYLIVGKTGEGKTTIFDAICFALFGVPSGSERTAAMLHSDFVPKSTDTVVTLDFVHQGREYHVERSIHFAKVRGTTDQYGEGKQSATLTGPDEAISGQEAVSSRCMELLGMDKDQFRRIVMLAQGEFREFMRANSDKKNEILGKLFDNTEYLRFQNLLGAARQSLEERRRAQRSAVETVMQTVFSLPEGPSELCAEDFLPDHPRLAENLRRLVREDELRLGEADKLRALRTERAERLTRAEGAAETDNRLLDELEQKRARLAALDAQAADFDAKRDAYAAAEKALHRVEPKAEALERAAQTAAQTRAELQQLEEQLALRRGTLEQAQAASEADAPKRARSEQLAAETAQLSEALPQYQALTEAEETLHGERAQLADTLTAAAELETRRGALNEALAATRGELKTLDGCEAALYRAQDEEKTAEERRDALASPDDGLAAQAEALLREEGALVAEEQTLRTLTQAAADADARRHALYQRFLSGQAGLIGAELEEQLERKGEAACPVCGAAFRSGDAHSFARPAEDTPRREDVDAAEQDAAEAERRRASKQSEIERRASALDERRASVAAGMRRLDPDCAGWGALTAPGYLAALSARLERALAEASQGRTAAQARFDRWKLLQRSEEETSAALEASETQRSAQGARRETLERSIHGLESRIAEMKKHLTYVNREAAQARLDALTRERDGLLAALDAHEKALTAAKADVDAAVGGRETLRKALPEQTAAEQRAGEALTRALAETGFATLDAARGALAPAAGADREGWLQARRAEIDEYDHAHRDTAQRILELTEQTKGKTRVNLEALREELAEAKRALADADDARAAQAGALEGHRQVLEQVAQAQAALAETDGAYRRIRRLAELAVSAQGDNGRLSFDRYVMGAIFREVLDMANRRLDTMTGGRFALVHSVDAGRKNAAAGLEMEVADMETGRQRASSSISGGEGFLVSLSLALGLSDVVQSHAGGQKLDTLFIDEGFGTLDVEKLDNVISVLQQLTEGNRLVGIISHVDKLEESIPQKLRVLPDKSGHGSTIIPELS